MAGRPHERERFFARLSLLLGCALLGMVLGGVGSRLRRSVGLTQPVKTQPVATQPALMQPIAPLAVPDLAMPPSVPDAGTRPVRELWVMVVDQSGQPVEGVSVLARPGLLTATTTTATVVGELGVLPGPLPFPEEVMAGQTAASGKLDRAGVSTGSWVAKSDVKGLVHFASVGSGRLLLLANFQGKSASGEVEVPVATDVSPAESVVRVVLRLASPVECAESLALDGSDPFAAATGVATRADLRGHLVDQRGFAVAMARIDVVVAGSRSQTQSDARGQFVLPMLPSGEAQLSVRAPGFAPLQQLVRAEQRREDLRVELRPGGGIAGLIEDARTSGLPDGVEVWLELSNGERWPVTLAPDGHFVQTGLPAGSVVVRARARGYAQVRQVVQVPSGSSPDQVTVRDVRLRFQRGAQLTGQVRGPQGNVEGADLQVRSEDGQTVAQARSDRRGEFELTDLPPGRLRLLVSCAQGSASLPIELRPGDRQRQDVEIGPR